VKHTPDQVRRENGILWCAIWREVGVTYHHRVKHRVLVRELNKRELMEEARKGGAHWLVEIGLLEAMRRSNGGLQTHIEDFVPTTQRGELGETPRA
jgi:hypothetical protein